MKSDCHVSFGSSASKRRYDVLGRFFGAGSIKPAASSRRRIVETDTVTRWCCCRCHWIVSGPRLTRCDEVDTQPDNQVDDRVIDPCWRRLRAPRPRLERHVTLDPIPRDQTRHPRPRNPIFGSYLSVGSPLNNNSSNNQTTLRHRPPCNTPTRFRCPDTSCSDVLNQNTSSRTTHSGFDNTLSACSRVAPAIPEHSTWADIECSAMCAGRDSALLSSGLCGVRQTREAFGE